MKIITGDAFETLPKMEDRSVDLVLTDPPYDLDNNKQKLLLLHLLRISRTATILFCPPENQFPSYPTIYYFWIKSISTKNTSKKPSRFVEMIQVFGKYKWNTDRHWSQYTNVFTDLVDNTKLHPFRKPPSLIRRLLLNHSDEGDIILDPFAGSGVIGEECLKLDRKHISIEIKERQ